MGRADELAELLDAFDEARHGSTRLALVEGEPGIGKTRLLEELAAEVSSAGACAAWGRCYEGGAAPSFRPWLGVLRALVASLPPERRDPVLSGGLGQLMGAGDAGSAIRSAPGVPGSADPTRFQVFESVADLLVEVAARQPVLVLIDDLQWADQASLELVEFLAQRLHDAQLLLVGSLRELEMGRNDAVVAAAATVARQAGVRRLRLRGLDETGTGQLIEQATGGPPSRRVVAAIHHRAEGNPFYATELARLMAAGPGSHGLDDTALAATAVPAGVRDVVRRRLAQLPPATLDLLAVAAVIGRDVDPGLLTRASGLSVERCLDDLDPALVTRLLLAVPDQPSTFRFAHALVREVVLDDVSPLIRRARDDAEAMSLAVLVRRADATAGRLGS